MIYYTEFFQKYFGDALNVVAHRNADCLYKVWKSP